MQNINVIQALELKTEKISINAQFRSMEISMIKARAICTIVITKLLSGAVNAYSQNSEHSDLKDEPIFCDMTSSILTRPDIKVNRLWI